MSSVRRALGLARRMIARAAGRDRRIIVSAVIFLAAAVLVLSAHSRVPLDTWMLWPYAGFAAATVGWVLSCLAVGHVALSLLPGLNIPFRERLLFDFAVGVLLFAIGLFVLGLFGLLRPPFYFVYPAGLLAIGGRSLAKFLWRAWRQFWPARRRARLRPSLPHVGALALGTLGLTVVYLTIMVPENAAFDARSYHLPIAEQFAAAGRIGPFPEGWFAGSLPHLASWLYTWPFTLRTVNLFGRVELAAHMEFALFVATVFSAPLLVEALRPGHRARGAWAVFFLFPGLFLYDSSLGLAADHVLAFWAAPMALAFRRWLQVPANKGRGALAGLMFAGAALTKYQSMYLLFPAAAVVVVVVVRQLLRSWRTATPRRELARSLAGPGALLLTILVATAPHWLANVVWHGNPVYPLLRNVFPSHPMVAGWGGTTLDPGFEPVGTLPEKLRETGLAVLTFGFVAHDWWASHRDVPVFGFLFTLTFPVLLLARGAGRARLLGACAFVGVAIWYWSYHQDRYLQALLPWMVGCTVAALQIAWENGMAARIGVVLLIAGQMAWGGDVPWIPTHAMTGDAPAIRALHRLSSTYRGDLKSRWRYDTGFEELDRLLPKDAYVLFHEDYLRLGLNRRSIQDSHRLQAGIDYRQLGRPDRVHDHLKKLGATHLVWNRSASANREIPVSGELVFFGYAMRHGEDQRPVGPYTLAKLPSQRPQPREPGLVAFIACDIATVVPLGEVDRLVAGERPPRAVPSEVGTAIAAAEFVVVDSRCQSRVMPEMVAAFVEAPRWGDITLWVRRQ